MPLSESWKAWAVPWDLALTESGNSGRLTRSTAATPSLRATPGRRLYEMVTAGNCPSWFTAMGPTPGLILATVDRGTSSPLEERTYRRVRASGLRWKSLRTSTKTV